MQGTGTVGSKQFQYTVHGRVNTEQLTLHTAHGNHCLQYIYIQYTVYSRVYNIHYRVVCTVYTIEGILQDEGGGLHP